MKDDELLLPDNLEDCIKSIIKREGYVKYKCDKKLISSQGGSYTGMLYEIDINGEVDETTKETNIFVKQIIDNASEVKIYTVSDIFKRELFAYSDLLKVFTTLQNEVNIPSSDRYNVMKSFDECNDKFIMLENISRKGFKTLFRMDVVSIDYARLCIEQLARFHGLSLVVKHKYPDYFKKKINTLNAPYIFKEDWKEFVNHMCGVSMKYLEDDIRKKVEKEVIAKVRKYPNYMTDKLSTICTVCHGDYRHNNIMMREKDGKVVEVMPLDYQIMFYGCPVLDFLYFIFWGTDQAFRKTHLTALKNLYYESMQKFLRYFDMNSEDVYPREEFEKSYREKLDFGLMISVIYFPFLFPVEDDVPDFNEDASISAMSFKIDQRFESRFRGIVDDYIQWGYL